MSAHRLGSILLPLTVGALPGCLARASALDPAGPQASRIHDLTAGFMLVSALVLALVVAATLAAVLRRRGAEAKDEAPILSNPKAERKLTRRVALATGATVFVLFGLLVASVRTGKALATFGGGPPLRVKVYGQQWWWDVHYVHPDPSMTVVTANEIHIPVGRPVRFELSSRDVIHSFWVPELHGKQDLVPGHPSSIVLQADRPGVYEGRCAEFCGHQHAKMRLLVVAEPPEAFEAWLEGQRAPAPAPVTELQKRGQEVFLRGPCVMCHAVAGTEAHAFVAPNLTHFASRRTLGAGAAPNTPGHLAGWITNSQSIKPGNHMPPVQLDSADLQALLAYLETLR